MPVTIHTQPQDALKFLKSHPVGVLATVDSHGNPHAAAVYFATDDTSNLYFLTKTGTKKVDNLQHNNHAVIVVYEAGTQTTVQVTGEVSEITDSAQMQAVFGKILEVSQAVSGHIPPISKLHEGVYIAYQLQPQEIRMAVFTQSESGGYKDIFETSHPQGMRQL